MRTFFRRLPRLLCNASLLLFAAAAAAQTLARPGWAGSGLASEAWWRNAVFYRIDVQHFQDADGDGVGDVRGVSERLEYLQSLGVDAVVLESLPPAAAQAETHFDDLLRAASSQHIRIVVSLGPADARDTATLLGTARRWLTRGAAGIALPSALLRAGSARSSAARELHALAAAMPGERVLLALPEAGSGAHAEMAMADGADLIGLSTDIPQRDTDAQFPGALRRALVDVQSPPGSSAPLLYSDNCCRTADAELFPGDAARTLGMNKITATRLMTSRGAVALLYGQEIGLVDAAAVSGSTVMRWTPSNRTMPEAIEPSAPLVAAQPAPHPDVYGEFKPYIAPKPVKKLTPEEAKRQSLDALPGFSTAAPSKEVQRSAANVAVQDADSSSLLSFYRRLSQLHHDNSSLRTGTPYVLDHDREQALVWVRRAPAGARTAATVVVACNLGAKPLVLSLNSDFERLRIRSGTLRPLLASWTQTPTVQLSDSVQLPPYSVFIGELFHDAR